MKQDEEMISKLKLFRNSIISRAELQDWFKNNYHNYEKVLSRTAFLTLKLGNDKSFPKILNELLPCCEKCGAIYDSAVFLSRDQFHLCCEKIDAAFKSGVLLKIEKPKWLELNYPSYVTSKFYCCKNCGGIWSLSAPDREFVGAWTRVA